MNNQALISKYRLPIIVWLLLCASLVASMVAVGGYTRLSGSGLSITEWKPIHGVIPPLDLEQWQEEFESYRATPQYAKVNQGMSLDEFKTIFWPEFWHRVLGRAIGMVFLLPLVFFAASGALSRRFGLRLLAIFTLGGLQGFIGWFMVASGLVDNPYVSHLRLALHLSIAFMLFALILWAALDLKQEQRQRPVVKLPLLFILWFAALCLQIVLGAFVAGLHAGLVFNTFPTMNGQWMPQELFSAGPWYENLAMVQFKHRWTAVVVVLGFIIWWSMARQSVRNKGLTGLCVAVALAIGLQFTLGVLTLLHVVPLGLALAHQLIALVLFGLAVWLMHGLIYKSESA